MKKENKIAYKASSDNAISYCADLFLILRIMVSGTIIKRLLIKLMQRDWASLMIEDYHSYARRRNLKWR